MPPTNVPGRTPIEMTVEPIIYCRTCNQTPSQIRAAQLLSTKRMRNQLKIGRRDFKPVHVTV
jgi:hypothetical protein